MKKISNFLYTAETPIQIRKDVEGMVAKREIPWLLILYLYDKYRRGNDKKIEQKQKVDEIKSKELKHREEVAETNRKHKEQMLLTRKKQEEKEKLQSKKKATSGDENPQAHETDMLEPLIPGGNDDKYRTMKPMLYPDIIDHKEYPYDYDIRMG